MSANTLSKEQLLKQVEILLMKYGHADASGDHRKRLEYKKALNHLAAEFFRRGYDISDAPYVRTIE
jgi:hypothetical protein